MVRDWKHACGAPASEKVYRGFRHQGAQRDVLAVRGRRQLRRGRDLVIGVRDQEQPAAELALELAAGPLVLIRTWRLGVAQSAPGSEFAPPLRLARPRLSLSIALPR
jgi:hypothetical protein